MFFPKRRAKIIATLGPAVDSRRAVEKLIRAGVNVARLNMSHGTHDDHRRRVLWVRRASKKLGTPVTVLMDLQGPKIRTGLLRNKKPAFLAKGKILRITTRPVEGTAERVSTNYRHLPRDVRRGDAILLDDGKMRLKVLSRSDSALKCRIMHGGWLKERAGMNLPESAIRLPALTPKDMEDLSFAKTMGVDAVALSFVRKAADVQRLKNILRRKRFFVPVIAKIERAEALVRLDEILEICEGVMVARGDLGVEVSLEKVPVLQKEILLKSNQFGTIGITATQMLESMMLSPRPTRAEASDVANAVFDGTDCLMLSGETAAGKYAVEAVRVMDGIIREAEEAMPSQKYREKYVQHGSSTEAVVYSAAHAAEEVDAKALLVFTMTGKTVRLISKLKPGKPVIGLTPSEGACRQMAMGWGVTPLISPLGRTIDGMLHYGMKAVVRAKLLKRGDKVVIVCGSHLTRGATNMMKITTL